MGLKRRREPGVCCRFAPRFCMCTRVRSASPTPGNTPVYLNVYDLTPVNGYVFWAGLGIFHSGIEVHGVEYAFGAHDYSLSGVFEVEPRQCPGFRFRKSILLGTTDRNAQQVREFMERESVNYNGDTYHLIAKNCNHFCEDMCHRLTGNSIPKWVNRLARLGAVCNCVLPHSLKVSQVHDNPHSQPEVDGKKWLSGSLCCFSSFSVLQRKVSTFSFRRTPETDTCEASKSRSMLLKES